MDANRRRWLQRSAVVGAGLVAAPLWWACGGEQSSAKSSTETIPGVRGLPKTKPSNWDAIAFNLERGLEGAIPTSYHADISGPVGETDHVGKHLPFIPSQLDPAKIPDGYLPVMWGDPARGYAKHPNAVRGPDNNNEGHWYDWIELRKATEDPADAMTTRFDDWPAPSNEVEGRIVALDGEDPTADSGKNTVYLVRLPADVSPGDTVRVWAHCLTHGEYVDFVTV